MFRIDCLVSIVALATSSILPTIAQAETIDRVVWDCESIAKTDGKNPDYRMQVLNRLTTATSNQPGDEKVLYWVAYLNPKSDRYEEQFTTEARFAISTQTPLLMNGLIISHNEFPDGFPESLKSIVTNESLLPSTRTTKIREDNSRSCLDFGICHDVTYDIHTYWIDESSSRLVRVLQSLPSNDREALVKKEILTPEALSGYLAIGEWLNSKSQE